MRLIDADDLTKTIREMYKISEKKGDIASLNCLTFVLILITIAPTINEEAE